MIRTISRSVLLLVFVLCISPALAWDGVEVTAVDGSVEHLGWGSASPTPYPCFWQHGDSPDLFFHATNGEAVGEEGMCDDPWLVHCNADSFSFQGAWPLTQSFTANAVEYGVDLSCRVSITVPTRLHAGRSVDADDLSADEHDLTLTYPDGSNELLLAAAPGPDLIQLDLEPGVYEVSLHVWAKGNRPQGQDSIQPYEGRVWLSWGDPGQVGTDSMAWSSLKALYR